MILRALPLVLVATAPLLAQSPTPTPSATVAPTPSATPAESPTPAPSPTPIPTLRQKVNSLKDDDVSKAVDAIKRQFLDGEKTSEAAMQRALLEGLLRRLDPGAELVDSRARQQDEGTPFLAEILDGHIGYIRLGSMEAGVLPQMDAVLTGFDPKKVDAVILDLREAAHGGSYEVAADVARRFCAKGKLLFTVQKPSAKQERIFTSNQDPAFQGVIVVLTDADTSGPAEALAATLRQNAGAMIIGAPTKGGAAEFYDNELSGNLVLRVAIAQVIVPEAGPIFPEGVKPDVAIALPAEVQAQIFRESKEKGVSQFVYDVERKRLNEAALVANTNPEIDSVQSIQRERGKGNPLRDGVLQRAVDLVTAINFYKAKQK
ncbi:peptidase family S41 [Terrimicrobium sacchariphilum]|uniref:Peptidase family S41 n=1 Tax=Terrimicrobium sacchariphilum TaxID=690879 RepID=A0A146GFZ3_TERSA|nr:S41 family peptidase [Terrimicrobium sacchariphilum]GAT35554.1 peptidase family S41 [Terrimicrobium sacchariphilum]